MEKPSIFISYSSKNSDTAENIHQQLESSGFDVWRDKTRLETDWSREIAQALADSDVLCLLWSEQAAQSEYVKHEWLTARALEKTIILCRLPEGPKPPEPLHNLQEVNLEDLTKGSQQLIGRLKDKNDFTVKYDYTVLPKNSYIPFNPNPNFTGRGQDLLELYLKLIGNLNKIGINQVGTVGMGGIGKTQLVVEFAYRFSFAFDSVYWTQAADEGKWLQQFIELARDRLQLSIASDPDKPEADKQYIYALQKYCKEKPDTLIIMDNVAEPKLLNSDAFLFGLTPLTLGCDLLFTTRKHFELPGISSQPVNILSPAGAYTLLTSYRTPQTIAEEKHAASICNAVGGLPLAIVLAGAFLKRYRSETPYSDYHDELLRNRLDTIDIGEISEKHLATRHEAAVTTTLKSQWEVLNDKYARTLFKLAGQFPEAEIIPKARLGLLAGIGPGKSKLDQPLDNAFDLLQDLNLMEKLEGDASAIRLHPLIHDFAIRLVPHEQSAAFKSAAAVKLKAACFVFSRLQRELGERGIKQLLGDMEVAIEWRGNDKQVFREMELLQSTLKLSVNSLQQDPNRLTTHLFKRLTSENKPEIMTLLEQAAVEKRGVWLRPITSSLRPPCGSLLVTLVAHGGQVTAVAITPDGETAVSASVDKTLKVWDLHSGECLQSLEGHGASVTAVTITPDGKTAVSASVDKTLKVWDLESGEVRQTLEGHSDCVDAVVITPDGKAAVSASWDATLRVWDLHAGEVLHTLEGHSDWVTAVAITPDGKTAVSVSDDTTLKVWDLDAGEVLHTLEGHSDEVTAVAITPDGKIAVSASRDATLKVWDLPSGEVLHTLEGHSDEVTAVAIVSDGKTAVSASRDATLRVWDLQAGEVLHTLRDDRLKVWDLHAAKVLHTLEEHRGEVTAVEITPDGKTVVSASDNRTLNVWDLPSGEVLHTLEGHRGQVTAVAITPDGKTAVSVSDDTTLRVWDLHAGEVLHTLEGHSDWVTAVAITPDGKTAVSVSDDTTLKVWDLPSGEVLHTLGGHSSQVTAVAIAPDGETAVSASRDATLRVWDLPSGEVLHTLEGHSGNVTAVAIAPDGKTAVSVSDDTTLKVWDLHAGLEIADFYADRSIDACCISPDGKTIVAGESSGRMHFLRLEGMN